MERCKYKKCLSSEEAKTAIKVLPAPVERASVPLDDLDIVQSEIGLKLLGQFGLDLAVLLEELVSHPSQPPVFAVQLGQGLVEPETG